LICYCIPITVGRQFSIDSQHLVTFCLIIKPLYILFDTGRTQTYG